ncbi:HNH endonuclease [Rhizobium gallicum]|uniref:HNH endonuclease n=1 Tax=Rhizobium gallicum TaxID=56730 RepID=UPI001EF8804C|nr:HNH endonuclease [Rhizobium gallicum]ULJ73641.1 HNH endonuclease [Rhizobium gallicum]
MARSTEEWIGRTDDAKVPPRVRLRVFEKYGRKCYLTGREIRPGDKWELEHVVSLILGGQHRESNMAPALAAPHKVKTAVEMKVKSKIAKVKKKHFGLGKPKGRGFSQRFGQRMDGTVYDKRTGEIIREGRR